MGKERELKTGSGHKSEVYVDRVKREIEKQRLNQKIGQRKSERRKGEKKTLKNR